ncbi:MAG: replicative DNA helicase [Bacteroidales bacterium]|nr:replicative DNA helicase [Bacteroidales bacterium]
MEFKLTEEQNKRQYAARRKPQQAAEVVNDFGKLQPQSTDLEEAVLGALMLETDAFGKVQEILSPECFYEPNNKKIYEAIQQLGTMSKPIDMLTVTNELRVLGTLDEVGGPIRISQLTSNVSSAANIEYHARIVAQKYLARELISFSSQIQSLAFDDSFDIFDVLEEAQGKLFELTQRNLKKEVCVVKDEVVKALNKIEEASNRTDGLSGLNTGFEEIDKMTSGWQNSDLVIIAARPAMGKTAFVLSMALRMAVRFNEPIAVFSLEMSNLQLVNRLISNICEIPGNAIKSGTLTPLQWEQLHSRIQPLYSAPLYIDDTPSLSVFELRTKARRLVHEHEVKMIVIDYLQLMNASGMKFGSREQEVSTISRSLKQLAKELDIPIIALSQLNRSVENRTDGKVPQLSDLRESGAIEQDADMVCFIHRPEYYLKSDVDAEGKDIKGLAEFIFAKHRSGAVGKIQLRFRGDFARFEDWGENELYGNHGIVASKLNAGTNPDNASNEAADSFTGSISEEHFLGGGNEPAAF